MQDDQKSAPNYGICDWLGQDLRRVLAPNPSPMTHHGTNTYLLGRGQVALIDPGPDDDAHLAAVLNALGPDERISHILVTHAHRDHSGLARKMAAATDAPVLAFGTAQAGRSAAMQALGQRDPSLEGEGVDTGFAPDQCLPDGATLTVGSAQISALHTPGHFGNHLCFRWGDVIFSGDHVMGWSSSVISPPDGDMAAYMKALQRLADQKPAKLFAGHGAVIDDPATRIGALITHRMARKAAVLAALGPGPATARDLARIIYHDTPPALHPAAARNVFAHLIELAQNGQAEPTADIAFTTAFRAR
ncbi:MAG: MBL fold metallo-hydrolase [Albidovulum sp.]